jgi:hypothetical protein
MVASDPHIAFGAVSCWYEVHLSGGSFDVAGTGYAGLPAVFFGRTPRVAWGITNNICSQRDLYQERTDPAHPGCFLFDGRWEPTGEVVEEIRVRGQRRCARPSASRATARSSTSCCRRRPAYRAGVAPLARRLALRRYLALGDEPGALGSELRERCAAGGRRGTWSSPTWTATSATRPPAPSRSAR